MRGTRLVDLWTFSAFDFNFDFIWTFFLCRDLVLFLASVTLVYAACCFWFWIWIWFRFWVLARRARYGIFAIMNGPGLGPHSKCQCYCTRTARVSFAPVHLYLCIFVSMNLWDILVFVHLALISIWRQKRRWLTFVCGVFVASWSHVEFPLFTTTHLKTHTETSTLIWNWKIFELQYTFKE